MKETCRTAGGMTPGERSGLLRLYNDTYKKVLNAYDDEERAEAQEKLDRIGEQLAELGIPIPGMGGRNPPNVATPQVPTQSNWD